jgi:hypothetical protein
MKAFAGHQPLDYGRQVARKLIAAKIENAYLAVVAVEQIWIWSFSLQAPRKAMQRVDKVDLVAAGRVRPLGGLEISDRLRVEMD